MGLGAYYLAYHWMRESLSGPGTNRLFTPYQYYLVMDIIRNATFMSLIRFSSILCASCINHHPAGPKNHEKFPDLSLLLA